MLKIEIETYNDAFFDDVASEVHACLSVVRRDLQEAMRPADGECPSWIVLPIRDTNGNTVGKAEYRSCIVNES